jgi:hypothetical protein
MTSDFAFVLGTGRCGSTLVHEVIARHPEVGFISNVDDRLPLPKVLSKWNNEIYRQVPESLTQKGRLRFAPSEGYRLLDREVSPALSAPSRDLDAEDVTPWLDKRLRRSFDDRAHVQGKPLFLHKFTGWPRAGFLGRVFPEAKFVNVIRDGRAVANSFLQMPWWRGYAGPTAWGWGPLPEPYEREWEEAGRSFAVLAGLQWKILMDAFEAAKAQIPEDRWLDIRYEDFVAEPREVVVPEMPQAQLLFLETVRFEITDNVEKSVSLVFALTFQKSELRTLQQLQASSRRGDRPMLHFLVPFHIPRAQLLDEINSDFQIAQVLNEAVITIQVFLNFRGM